MASVFSLLSLAHLRMTITSQLATVFALILATNACADVVSADLDRHTPIEAEIPAVTLAKFECTVDLVTERTRCSEPETPGIRGISAALLGQNQIKMASSGLVIDTIAGITSFDATLQNLLSYPIGTPDGVIVAGSKVYFERTPYVTAYKTPGDTGTVVVSNPDGHADYTGADQPYYFYPNILAPQQISTPKRWIYRVPRTVSSFKFSVKVFTAIPGEAKVTPLPPDTVPAALYDSANIMLDSPHLRFSRRALRGILAIRFNPSATRDERQSAIDVIRGEVVGGRPVHGIEGYYLAKISDDGTGQQMRLAMDTLSKIPSVATVLPEYLWTPEEFQTYVEPEDAGDWRKPWQLNPATSNGANWALEAIAAPQAWACETGSAAVKVGVVDMGYFSDSDLTANTSYAPAMDVYDTFFTRDDYHGTAVSSVLAARGNNQHGITGVMWDADLRLYDISVRDDGSTRTERFGGLMRFFRTPVPVMALVEQRLAQAINSGAHVINVSLAVPRSAQDSVAPQELHATIQSMANNYAAVINAATNKPLVVIGAGNDGQDAYYGVLPLLAELVPDQVIVVGGIETVTDDYAPLWIGASGQSTNYNSSAIGKQLVQIAAPAQSVGVLKPGGSAVKSGTSLSAPLVAGIAGLLKAFDYRLTAAEIKALLIEGASRGRRYVPMGGNTYVANAHQSLVAASERPGAPLCGGVPVWRDEQTGAVQIRRIAEPATGRIVGPLETLFTLPGSDLMPFQGESTIRVDQSFMGWTAGAWTNYESGRTDLYGNATNRSKLGQSHDADRHVTASRIEVNDTLEVYRIEVNGALLAEVTSKYAKKPSVPGCARYTNANVCLTPADIWYDRIMSNARVAYSPRGDEVILTISRQKSTHSQGVPYACGADWCRDIRLLVTTLASEIVSIRVADGQLRDRRPGPIRFIQQVGLSEDGMRLVFVTEFTDSDVETHTGSGTTTTHSNNWFCDGRYTTRAATTLVSMPLRRQVAQCYTSATFSP